MHRGCRALFLAREGIPIPVSVAETRWMAGAHDKAPHRRSVSTELVVCEGSDSCKPLFEGKSRLDREEVGVAPALVIRGDSSLPKARRPRLLIKQRRVSWVTVRASGTSSVSMMWSDCLALFYLKCTLDQVPAQLQGIGLKPPRTHFCYQLSQRHIR